MTSGHGTKYLGQESELICIKDEMIITHNKIHMHQRLEINSRHGSIFLNGNTFGMHFFVNVLRSLLSL